MSKFGTYAWFGGKVSMDLRFKAIKEAGFDSVALLCSDEYESEIGKLSEHIKCALKYHLEIENFHLPYSNASDLFSDDVTASAKLINEYLNCIEMAYKNNVPVVVIHLTGDNVTYPINEAGYKRIQILVDYAKEVNVKLAFENLREEGLNYLYGVLDYFSYDETVGMCYDFGHDFCFSNMNVGKNLIKYSNRVYVTHLHGNDGKWDYHLKLSDGKASLQMLKEILKEGNITCPLSLEVIQPLNINTYDEILQYAKSMMDDLLKLV